MELFVKIVHRGYVAKGKKGSKEKKERVPKWKLLKGCHQGQNVAVLAILELMEFKKCSYRPTMVTDNSFHCSIPPYFEIHLAGPVVTIFAKSFILNV